MSVGSKYPRGSEWRKWDLHFHTPSSHDYKDKSLSDDDIIKKLKENKVSVVAITDHHVIDVERIKNLQKLASDQITILPGIEFRSELGGSESIHFIGIFPEGSESFDLNTAWVKLQGNLPITPDEIKKKGDENIQCDLKDTAELIHELGGIVTIHAGSKTHTIENITNALPYKQAQKEEIVSFIDIYEIGKTEDQEGYKENVFPNIKKRISMIICSDNHNIKDYTLKANCWIKADPTFEGLKQILYEPDERVYIGVSPPSEKTSDHVIDRVEIKDSKNWFEEKPILLNENLVTIIGEKGAGKTALADFIALAGGDFDIGSPDDPGLFVFKALKSTKQIGETIEDCTVIVHWRDGSQNTIKISDDFSDYKGSKRVRYLSQSFIERKCSPEQADELQREIENIIFQHIPIQDRLGQTTFLDLKELKTKSIRLKQSSSRKTIDSLNGDIFNSEVEINSLTEKKEEKLKHQTEIKQLENQKPKPTTQEEKNIEDKLNLLNNRRTDLNEKIASYKAQLTTIETIKVQVSELKEYVEGKLTDIKDNLESIDLVNIFDKIKFSIHNDFNTELDKKKEAILAQIKSLQGAEKREDVTDKKDIEDINLGSLTDDYINSLTLDKIISLIDVLESRSSIAKEKRKVIKTFEEQIRKKQKRVNELEKDIKDIENVKKPLLPKKKNERDEAYKGYFELLQKEKKILEEIYSSLREKLSKENIGQENKIDFFARLEFNVGNFFNKADSLIDFSRKGRYYRGESKLFKAIKNIAEKIELAEDLDIYNHILQLYQSFEQDNGKVFNIDDQLLKDKKKIDFYNWIFDVSDFKVTYSIKYQDTNIELLSPGKKGIVLLLMYLALDTESSVPLVIDQPEENLDNKSVYTDLINFFRVAKKRRQIIVITHNPNLVLNTDAEQVIVANFEAIPKVYQSRLTYISGAIENSFIDEKLLIPLLRKGIREHGADILEGGREAFIKRKDKYAY